MKAAIVAPVERICKLCGGSFIPDRTFVFCPPCSRVTMSRNYSSLAPDEKKLRNEYLRRFCKQYSKPPNIQYILQNNRKWRRGNPKKRYLQKKREVDRYTEETLESAVNHRQGWTSDDLDYLKQQGLLRTARQIAWDLGRTYMAIMVKASVEKITLLTDAKIHGGLVTKRR